MPGVTAEELEQSINDAASIYTLDASRNVGDIFYEPSTTANIEHDMLVFTTLLIL